MVLATAVVVLVVLDAHDVWSPSSWGDFIQSFSPFGVVVTIPLVAAGSWYSLHAALVGFALAVKSPSAAARSEVGAR